MWKRKELKKRARAALKQNYLHAILVCIILALFVGEYPTYHDISVPQAELSSVHFRTASNSEIVNSIMQNVEAGSNPLVGIIGQEQATQGILANLFNNVTRSGSFVFGTLNAINQFAFGDRVMAGVIILVGTAITFLYWLLVGNILRIGACRFFMEGDAYPGTKTDRLLYLYRIRRVGRPALIMFLKTLYVVLWSLTLVGGLIKYYSYRMVPYIVAENPDILPKQAFKLSRQMMRGNKWKCFLLDVSFVGWHLLGLATFGLSSYLFAHPYMSATEAQLYLKLRQRAETPELLNDAYLCAPADGEVPGQYPVHLFPIPEHSGRAWLSTDYMTRYSLTNIVLIFFTFCMVGWLWEVFVVLFNTGVLQNRGTMYGPWLPIYGTGGVGVILLFRRLGKRPLVTFLAVTAFCGVLEFCTSWALEALTGKAWWDYTGYFLNIQGRVCLEGLLVFGVGGCLGIYFLGPALNNLFNKIPQKPRRIVAACLSALFLGDLVVSAIHPNTAAVTQPGSGGAPAESKPSE